MAAAVDSSMVADSGKTRSFGHNSQLSLPAAEAHWNSCYKEEYTVLYSEPLKSGQTTDYRLLYSGNININEQSALRDANTARWP